MGSLQSSNNRPDNASPCSPLQKNTMDPQKAPLEAASIWECDICTKTWETFTEAAACEQRCLPLKEVTVEQGGNADELSALSPPRREDVSAQPQTIDLTHESDEDNINCGDADASSPIVDDSGKVEDEGGMGSSEHTSEQCVYEGVEEYDIREAADPLNRSIFTCDGGGKKRRLNEDRKKLRKEPLKKPPGPGWTFKLVQNGPSNVYHWVSPVINKEFRRRAEAREFEQLRRAHDNESAAWEAYVKIKHKHGAALKVVGGMTPYDKKIIEQLEKEEKDGDELVGQTSMKAKKKPKLNDVTLDREERDGGVNKLATLSHGWTVKKRPSGQLTTTHYLSPKLEIEFRSYAKAREFDNTLSKCTDESKAADEFVCEIGWDKFSNSVSNLGRYIPKHRRKSSNKEGSMKGKAASQPKTSNNASQPKISKSLTTQNESSNTERNGKKKRQRWNELVERQTDGAERAESIEAEVRRPTETDENAEANVNAEADGILSKDPACRDRDAVVDAPSYAELREGAIEDDEGNGKEKEDGEGGLILMKEEESKAKMESLVGDFSVSGRHTEQAAQVARAPGNDGMARNNQLSVDRPRCAGRNSDVLPAVCSSNRDAESRGQCPGGGTEQAPNRSVDQVAGPGRALGGDGRMCNSHLAAGKLCRAERNGDDLPAVSVSSHGDDAESRDQCPGAGTKCAPKSSADDTEEDAIRALLGLDVFSLTLEDLRQKVAEIQGMFAPRMHFPEPDDLRQKMAQIQDVPRVQCPDGYDPEVFNALPEDMQREYKTKLKDVQKAEKKGRRCRGEIMRLKNHMKSGMDDHAPIDAGTMKSNTAPLVIDVDDDEALLELNAVKQRFAKQGAGNKIMAKRKWGDMKLISDKPTLYQEGLIPRRVIKIAGELKDELFNVELKSSGLIRGAQEVGGFGSGYFKGHLAESLSRELRDLDFLPARFRVKGKAAQKSIVFHNEREGQCDCHFDRDSSVLFLVTGRKEVRMARRPVRGHDKTGDGTSPFEGIDPFSSDRRAHGDFEWESVSMVPGSALFIPKNWLHCIRSLPDTLALSFQVEFKEDGDLRPSTASPSPTFGADTDGGKATAAGDVFASLSRGESSLDRVHPRIHTNQVRGAKVGNTKSSAGAGVVSTPRSKSSHERAQSQSRVNQIRSAVDSNTKASTASDGSTSASRGESLHECTGFQTHAKPARAPFETEAPTSVVWPKLESDLPCRGSRRSRRERLRCGVCSRNAFVGDGGVEEEMWMLMCEELPLAGMRQCPTKIPQHLVCFACRPRNRDGMMDPCEKIRWPGGVLRPILTADEFWKKEGLDPKYFGNYAYVTGSKVDYTTKIVNRGHALLGQAGMEFDINSIQKIIVKSEG